MPTFGSSPLARGTQQLMTSRFNAWRFIPACAGNSDPGPRSEPEPSVHPRLRGELQNPNSEKKDAIRFIPACAGNSCRIEKLTHPKTVHPRLRGELDELNTPRRLQKGSSPLARGTRDFSCL